MAIKRPRTRVVYFRVSQDEYDQYIHFCQDCGAHSLSELSRSAVRQLVDGAAPEWYRLIERRLAAIEQKLDSVTVAMQGRKRQTLTLGSIEEEAG